MHTAAATKCSSHCHPGPDLTPDRPAQPGGAAPGVPRPTPAPALPSRGRPAPVRLVPPRPAMLHLAPRLSLVTTRLSVLGDAAAPFGF
jgi:hypothetical protein